MLFKRYSALITRLVLFTFLVLCLISCSGSSKSSSSIPDQAFNKDWLFHKGSIEGAESISFDDRSWRKLDLPHDWAIEGPFDSKYNARTGGLPVHGTGWYRKHFTIDQSLKGKRVSIEFDGAMNRANIWVNGQFVGKRPYGYIGFEFDITSHVEFGKENIIAVRLMPEDLASRWYSGAGIYRNVRIKYNEPIHVANWGTYITTPQVSEKQADVSIVTTLNNTSGASANIILETDIKGKDGTIVTSASSKVTIDAKESKVTQQLKVDMPKRWDIDNPYLYTAVITIKMDEKIIDEFRSTFGIRNIEFTANHGFLLNGKRLQFNGVCLHHDLGPLGAAVNYRATERQMEIMKSMGVNALRTSHNPPSPEMLEVCDKLGILVQVEAFDEWKIPKVPNGYSKFFDEWHERDLRDMIKRDRNHPSVIMWSIGNEILEQSRSDGWKVAKTLNDICHDEDPTRPTTAGFNYYPAPFTNKLAYQIDVVGMNYKPRKYDSIKTHNPEMIIYGSETSSQTSSRGVYHLPIEATERHETGHISSYDAIIGPPWAYPPDAEFEMQETNSFLLGEFIWTGIDYLGEPTPFGGKDNSTNGYWNFDWPSRSSYFAPVDLSGFPKDRYFLYQSQWTTEPMVHVLPHWNWEGNEGNIIPVFAYTNAEEVELFVNGNSYGKKVKRKDLTDIFAEFNGFKKGVFHSKYRLSWEVPYATGSLKVVAYTNGKPVAEKEIKTAGKPARIALYTDRSTIHADGKDLSFITVRIEDTEGNLCPLADNQVDFKINGAGSLAAVGNGNQRSIESFQEPRRKAFSGLCLLVVKSGDEEGEINITATSTGLESATTKVLVLEEPL